MAIIKLVSEKYVFVLIADMSSIVEINWYFFPYLQFLLIFRKANAGELLEESGLSKLAKLTEIDVVEVGVGGAKEFFEAKVNHEWKN